MLNSKEKNPSSVQSSSGQAKKTKPISRGRNCCVIGCNMTQFKAKEQGFSMFNVVRKDPEQTKQFIKAINRENAEDGTQWKPSKFSMICGRHFTTGKPNKATLHVDYFPTLNMAAGNDDNTEESSEFDDQGRNNSDSTPWSFQSLYDLQYFNCPCCTFKENAKQEFVNHVCYLHAELLQHLRNINDGSMSDIEIPVEKIGKKYALKN